MAAISSILHRAISEIRFGVDPVQPCSQLLPLQNAKLQFEQHHKKPILAFSHCESFEVVKDRCSHPLAAAVHHAFSEHRPLLLTPDIIWMLLAQGFAQHINNCAEELRSRFVGHSGKKTLKVTALELTEPHHWTEAIEQWTLQIRDCVGADFYRLMECNFSTSTPTTRTASHVVMMDAVQQYFDYKLYCVCGIPEITLRGTVEDWQNIRDRVEAMAQYELNWWTKRVVPICQEFIETAAGKPKLEFWQSIYKPQTIYGDEVITGWLGYLFPYLKHSITQGHSVKNPMLAIAPEELTVENGIHFRSLPSGLSCVPFTLDAPTCKEYPLELVAGFIGIRQHSNNILEPEIGWAVREGNPLDQLLNLLQQEHQTSAPIDWEQSKFCFDGISAELVQLLERFDGATLFADTDRPWHIRKCQDWQRYNFIEIENKSRISATDFYSRHLIIDLNDGRCIFYLEVNRCIGSLKAGFKRLPSECWVVVGKPVKYLHPLTAWETIGLNPEDTKVIAKSFVQLFERIIAEKGHYYFDNPDFQPDDSLLSLSK
ncbi:MAG TPA: DUF4419 domain-containing protein [Kamptonema sp.]|nr:DUF4419 domain-containing protein [Kamptonema sp.]